MKAYDRYIKVSNALELLILSGQGENMEADDLRDEMDRWWIELTDEERKEHARNKSYRAHMFKAM